MMKFRIVYAILIVLLGALIYSNSFHAPFQFDDREYIERSIPIRDVATMTSIWDRGFISSRIVALYTFHLNYRLGGLDVFGYHLVNWVIHILATLCVWWLTVLLLSSPRMKDDPLSAHKQAISFFVALLFLCHPLQTQAVTYITQRFASLATLFYLLSVSLYIKGRLEGRVHVRRNLFFALAAISAGLGMMTKQIVITLPLTVILVEFFFFTGFDCKKRIKYLIPVLLFLLIIPAFYSFNVAGMLSMRAYSSSHEGDVLNSYTYLLTQFRVILTYLRLLVFPIGQSFDYDFAASSSLLEIPALMSIMVIFIIIALAFQLRKEYPLIAFGTFWFFLTLSVESSLIPIQHVIFEHRLYLPSFGFFLVVGALLFGFMNDRYKRVAVLSVIVMTLSYLTYQRNNVWTSRITFWQDVINKSPSKARGYVNLGLSYLEEQKNIEAMQYLTAAIALNPKSKGAYNLRGVLHTRLGMHDRAMADFDRALKIDPGLQAAYVNRGNLYNILGDQDAALDNYNKALSVNPRHGEALVNKGHALVRKGAYRQALVQYDKAISYYPYYGEAYKNRAKVHEILQRLDRALRDYNTALEYDPDDRDLYIGRGDVLAKKKQFREALADYNNALELDPKNSAVLYKRGNVYFYLNQVERALQDYDQAIRYDPSNPDPYVNMGVIYAREGKFEQALKAFNRAIELDPEHGSTYYRRSSVFQALRQPRRAWEDALKARALGVNVHPEYIRALEESL